MSVEETKIIYYIDDDKLPYLIKLNKPPEQATLRDFKNALNDQRPFKYFFQAVVDDFGIVKEEISDEDAKLPFVSGRVVSWLIPVEGSIAGSDTRSNHSLTAAGGQQTNDGSADQASSSTNGVSRSNTHRSSNTQLVPNDSCDNQKSGSSLKSGSLNGRRSSQKSHEIYGVNNKMALPPSKPIKHHHRSNHSKNSFRDDDTCSEIESIIDSIDEIRIQRGMDGSLSRRNKPQFNSFNNHMQHPKMAAKDMGQKRLSQQNNYKNGIHYDSQLTQSLTSDFDNDTTFFDTEDDDAFSFISEKTDNSMRKYGQNRAKRRIKHKYDSHMRSTSSLHSSVSSSIDTTISVDVMTITLTLDKVNFLGISIVGQSNKSGEGGIYVSSIMSGGAVARDGRIEPGDMILQVNNVSFENLSNEEAVQALRDAVTKPGPIKLVIAKCWLPNQHEKPGAAPVRNQDPIHPIDTRAWVAHTHAHMMDAKNKKFLGDTISSFGDDTTSLTSTYSDLTLGSTRRDGGTTVAESTVYNTQLDLTVETDLETITQAMMNPASGLDVRDRNWLKLTIPNAFTGSDVVDWLFLHVEGFPERRDAKKFAATLLKYGYIRHATHKTTFSEQCYYVFDYSNNTRTEPKLFTLNEESDFDFDSVSELENDTLYAPMPINCAPPGSYATNGAAGGQNGMAANAAAQIYGQHPAKMYTNLNGIGIGGPPPPPSYISSSSSNATSNSTSTTSNNTTSQTISTKAGGSGSSLTKHHQQQHQQGNFVVNADRANACQFYYPPPSSQMTTLNNTNYTNTSANYTIANNSTVNYTHHNTMTSTSSSGSLYRVAQNGHKYEDQFNTITTINSSVSSNQTIGSQDYEASSVNTTTRDENTTLNGSNHYNSISDSRGNSFFQIKPVYMSLKTKEHPDQLPFNEQVLNKQQQHQQQQGPPGSAGLTFKVPALPGSNLVRQKSSEKVNGIKPSSEVFVDVM